MLLFKRESPDVLPAGNTEILGLLNEEPVYEKNNVFVNLFAVFC